ncbi:MAG: response regulator transcription factor [Solirubrobacteraceae bacterium]
MEPAPPTIAIVEDHVATRRFLADNLTADGYVPRIARGVAEALEVIAESLPAAAIIDLGLPDGDGLELLRALRDSDRFEPTLPILVLSGRASEVDRLRGFERGCDDYVVKPFSYVELRARLVALLRRAGAGPRRGRVRVGTLELDPIARTVHIGGRPVHLSRKEFSLLRMLATDPGRVFTREELLREVWGFAEPVGTRTVDSHACRLRRKLDLGSQRFVLNVWGIGYRLLDEEGMR